jgi:hypothetical protein
MNPDLIRTIATEIVQQTLLDNWLFYATIALLTVVSSIASAYAIEYAKTRGKALATRADFDLLLDQVSQTTKVTNKISQDISHSDWALKEYKVLRRIKLEELLTTTYDAIDWLDKHKDSNIFDGDEIKTSSPITKARIIGTLYFPELKQNIDDLVSAHDKHYFWSMKGKSILLPYKSEERLIDLEYKQPTTTLEQLSSLQTRMKILQDSRTKAMQSIVDDYPNIYNPLIHSLNNIRIQASELMSNLIAVQ